MQRIQQMTGFNSRNGSAGTKRTHTMRLLVATVGLVWLAAVGGEAAAMRHRRSATSDDHYAYADGSTGTSYDRININYDEYPMIVPKRAALLLDRLMVALHHALEDGDQEGVRRINDLYRQQTTKAPPSPLPLPRAGSYNNGAMSSEYAAANSKQASPAKFVQSYRLDGVSDDMSGYADRSTDAARPKQQKQQMNEEMMGMQRRGHAGEALGASKGHVYWRCYFNAVSCF